MCTVTRYKLKETDEIVYLKQLTQGIKVYVKPKKQDTIEISLLVKYGNKDTLYKTRLDFNTEYVRKGIAEELQKKFFNDDVKAVFKKLDSKTILNVKDSYSNYLIHVSSNQYVNPLRKLMASIFKYKNFDNGFSYEVDKAYKVFYTPNNMKLIICGDVKPNEVFKQVEKILKKLNVKNEPRVIKEK